MLPARQTTTKTHEEVDEYDMLPVEVLRRHADLLPAGIVQRTEHFNRSFPFFENKLIKQHPQPTFTDDVQEVTVNFKKEHTWLAKQAPIRRTRVDSSLESFSLSLTERPTRLAWEQMHFWAVLWLPLEQLSEGSEPCIREFLQDRGMPLDGAGGVYTAFTSWWTRQAGDAGEPQAEACLSEIAAFAAHRLK